MASELKFGDLIVHHSFPEAVLLYWGKNGGGRGSAIIVTVLRKQKTWDEGIYRVGRTMVWDSGWAWKRVKEMPDAAK